MSGCKKEGANTKITSLEFKKGSYELYENDSDKNMKKELVAAPDGILDKEKIVWKVSDEEVAEMSGNFLVPIMPGDVKVTATVQNISATCNVSILPVPVESITLEDMTVALYGSSQIKCTTVPSGISLKRITFSSSDDDIAYVNSDGMVQGKGTGDATITATVDDKTATCKVTVSAKKVISVTVTPATHNFSGKGETITLEAVIEPEDASFKEIKWSSSDEAVAIVDETTGVVTSKGSGKANIIATAVKDNVTGVCKVEVPKVGVESVTVSTNKIRTESQSFTQTLTATIMPAEASDLPVKWTAKGIANVDANGKVSVTGGGYGVVYAEVEGVKDSCEVYVKDLRHNMRDCQAHLYYTTVINGQEWMAENMHCNIYDTYSPKKGVQIETSSSSVCTPYYFDGKNYEKGTTCFTIYDRNRFGYSYNWAAAVGVDKGDDANTSLPAKPQGICPNGWHVSTIDDWSVLFENINRPFIKFYNTSTHRDEWYSKAFSNLVSTTGWCGMEVLDEFGFCALPVGKGGYNYLNDFGSKGYFWTPSTTSGMSSYKFADCICFSQGSGSATLYDSAKELTASVRCVKN
ncbi:MAG: Ig-like domain-containing protein [Paludibacteraceae bacterium]|nr:Ig-like domain-containing protein [Paludibacteraceae bacterium]